MYKITTYHEQTFHDIAQLRFNGFTVVIPGVTRLTVKRKRELADTWMREFATDDQRATWDVLDDLARDAWADFRAHRVGVLRLTWRTVTAPDGTSHDEVSYSTSSSGGSDSVGSFFVQGFTSPGK
jgi:hypothetical protein